MPTPVPFAYRPDRPVATTTVAEFEASVGSQAPAWVTAESVAAQWHEQPTRAVLVVLQAVNAGGKDGTIEALRESTALPSLRVERLKRPLNPVAHHDLLKLGVSLAPGPGELVFFNRSYYEDLVHAALHQASDFPRVCEAILLLENELASSRVSLLKLHLHIDQDEQRRRLDARRHPHLRHLLNPWDYHDQAIWQQLMEAYDAVFTATHTTASPWLVIPANDRGFRNQAVLHLLSGVLGEGSSDPGESTGAPSS